MCEWEFTTIKTRNGIFETTGNGCSYVGDEQGPCEYVVLAECEQPPGTYGILGAGHTEEQARQVVDLRIAEYERRKETYRCNCAVVQND